MKDICEIGTVSGLKVYVRWHNVPIGSGTALSVYVDHLSNPKVCDGSKEAKKAIKQQDLGMRIVQSFARNLVKKGYTVQSEPYLDEDRTAYAIAQFSHASPNLEAFEVAALTVLDTVREEILKEEIYRRG
ncbi:MAG: hypothetical protein K2Q01_08420, partial [Rickettsiales bacterium]|nr:hypothetical protein [Rickettsiales bacterium]